MACDSGTKVKNLQIEPRTFKMNWKKARKYITVEPVLLSIVIPIYLLNISMQNLTLEKSCRVNLALDDIVCNAMMDKAKFKINCALYDHSLHTQNRSIDSLFNNDRTNQTEEDLIARVCWAEKESQIIGSSIRAYISPFESLFSMILVLFAGRWSDRSGKVIPCILYPLYGNLGMFLTCLIGAIFMKQLPVEFNLILSILLPGLFGGFGLLLMGLFRYLTAISTKDNRIIRFTILSQINSITSMLVLPFSGIVYSKLGYIKALSIGIIVVLSGIFYTLVFLKEIDQKKVKELRLNAAEEDEITVSTKGGNLKKSNVLSGFFSWKVVTDSCSLIAKEREGYSSKIVTTVLILSVFDVGPHWGEVFNEYFFVRTKLNWEALQEASFAAYGSLTRFIGSFIMIFGIGKCLKLSDAMIGILASIFATISKIIYVTVSTTTMLYLAKTADMFSGITQNVPKSIVSSVIESSEIGRMYSIIGVLENLSKLIFIPIFNTTFKLTISSFPNAYFLWSTLCTAIVMTLFIVIYCYFRKDEHLKMEKVADLERGANANLQPLLDENK